MSDTSINRQNIKDIKVCFVTDKELEADLATTKF